VADLVTGERDQLGSWWWVADAWSRAATTRKAWASMARVTQRYQERQRRDLVLIQASKALAGLERLLYTPAGSGDLDQGDQRQAGRAGAHT
jgi:hypothetical protein